MLLFHILTKLVVFFQVQYINTQPSMIVQSSQSSAQTTTYPSAPAAYPPVPAYQTFGYHPVYQQYPPPQYGYMAHQCKYCCYIGKSLRVKCLENLNYIHWECEDFVSI